MHYSSLHLVSLKQHLKLKRREEQNKMDRILQEAERKRCEAWNNMQRAAGDLGRSVQMAVSHVQLQTKGIEQHFKNAEATVKAVVMGFHSQWVQIQHQQAMFGSVPFASITMGGMGGRRTPVVGDLALHPVEIESRLRDVTVYTLLDQQNQFILVSGSDSGKEGATTKSLGLFFLNKEDADAVLSRLAKDDPTMAKTAKVVPVGMDKVYTFTSRSVPEELEEVSFRIFPSMAEVQAALEVLRADGIVQRSFPGVPLFQAEGLTIKADAPNEGAKMTPLFFSKEDLDAAVRSAFDRREQKRMQAVEETVRRARAEFDKANAELERAADAGDDRQQKKAQTKVERAQQRVDKAEKRLADALRKAKAPKVEVGTLEEVLTSMERDVKGEWADVMFVPPHAISSAKKGATAGATAGGK